MPEKILVEGRKISSYITQLTDGDNTTWRLVLSKCYKRSQQESVSRAGRKERVFHITDTLGNHSFGSIVEVAMPTSSGIMIKFDDSSQRGASYVVAGEACLDGQSIPDALRNRDTAAVIIERAL